MRRTLLLVALLLTGCAETVPYDEFQATRRIAMEAHDRAELAEQRVEEQKARIDDLESRLDMVCEAAPRLCE